MMRDLDTVGFVNRDPAGPKPNAESKATEPESIRVVWTKNRGRG